MGALEPVLGKKESPCSEKRTTAREMLSSEDTAQAKINKCTYFNNNNKKKSKEEKKASEGGRKGGKKEREKGREEGRNREGRGEDLLICEKK